MMWKVSSLVEREMETEFEAIRESEEGMVVKWRETLGINRCACVHGLDEQVRVSLKILCIFKV